MNVHSPNQALARTLRRAGLVDGEGVPLVSPHGLRHTAASLMLAAGVPLIVVSRQLGHANPNITAQVYAHLLGDEQLDQAAACFRGAGAGGAVPGDGSGRAGGRLGAAGALADARRRSPLRPAGRCRVRAGGRRLKADARAM